MSESKYLEEILQFKREDLSSIAKSVIWKAPANIALIKYWGKKGNQLPINPSLSMSLSSSHTRTELQYRKAENNYGRITFKFNGEKHPAFEERVKAFIDKILPFFPFLKYMELFIYSKNNFPHSAGIASSASALSSLALCICSVEKQLKEEYSGTEDFLQKASYMARLGSGSAARSVYGHYVEWGASGNGTDDFATPLTSEVSENMEFLYDTVLITSSEPKKISSSQGHSLMNDHPYKEDRISQARINFSQLKETLKTGNFEKFTEIIENEALSLHALMLSSNPGFILINDASIKIMDRVRAYRQETGAQMAFTLDAGPNIHLLYPAEEKENIRNFIDNKLRGLCESGRTLNDFTGNGPEQPDKDQNL
ncbi:MAG: diphosphomevalonate decarboxylase [Bacteroidales bacterium]